MIAYLLMLELVCLRTSLVHWIFFHGFWSIKSWVEETLIIFGPWHATEFNPFQFIMLKVLASLSISYLDGGPVRTSNFDLVSQVFSIITPDGSTKSGSSIFWHCVGINPNLSSFQRLIWIDLVTVLFCESIMAELVLESCIVGEIVVVAVFVKASSFSIVPHFSHFCFYWITGWACCKDFLC